MDDVPATHPRHESLAVRERLVAGVEAGLTSRAGLIAHGRGEAFDYLLGERTTAGAARATRAAAARLLLADRPVVSVNGNAAALVPDGLVALADAVDAALEVNLYHRTDERLRAIAAHLREHGASEVKGLTGDGRLPGLDHDRGRVDADGIGAADAVLVPLEDGDRAAALAAAGIDEVVIDLNPLSRSARAATIPVVDDVVRAVPNLTAHARALSGDGDGDDAPDPERLRALVEDFDADRALAAAERRIREGA
jgi:4-phosphopantoate--beta-alanine ligase